MPVNVRPTYPINVNNPKILRRNSRIWDEKFYAASTLCFGANCREFPRCLTPNRKWLLFSPGEVLLLTRRPSVGPASPANPSAFAT
jgi:hypothetical protein